MRNSTPGQNWNLFARQWLAMEASLKSKSRPKIWWRLASPMTCNALLCVSFGLLFSLATTAHAQESDYVLGCMQAFPDHIQARMEVRDRALTNASRSVGLVAYSYIFEREKTWIPGQTITVAFPENHDYERVRQITEVASQWKQYANIEFDFGHDDQYRTFRTFSSNDASFSADIRISFVQFGSGAGYWSLVGIDARNADIIGPGEASMNLGRIGVATPTQWQATVLHEFGHALGFHHMHQHPTDGCNLEFRFLDDPGYQPELNHRGEYVTNANGARPGLYTILAGKPNEWNKAKVDFNLKQLENSRAYVTGPFDPTSIMMYSFKPWMFINGSQSACYTSPNSTLAAIDQQGANNAYPQALADIRRVIDEQTVGLRSILESFSTSEQMSGSEINERVQQRLQALEQARIEGI